MKKLYIFSYGLYPGQLTLETLAAMRECGAVYTHCLDAATARQFAKLSPGIRLTAGLDRLQTARAAVSGLKKYDTVGFLTYGNPLFLNQTAAELMKAAKKKNVEVEVLAAVSSFDALVNLFNLNKYSAGSLRVADTAALVNRTVFTPEEDTLFFVPDVLNLPANAGFKKKFIAAAQKAYPPSAPVYLADCASISSRKATVLEEKMASLPSLLAKVNERHTLFIPAAKKQPQGRKSGKP